MTIPEALHPIGLSPVHPPYMGSEETFVTYAMLNEDGVVFADGDEQAGEVLYSVDVFTKTAWESTVSSIKAALKSAGYKVQNTGPEIYETDTKLYHIPILVSEDL